LLHLVGSSILLYLIDDARSKIKFMEEVLMCSLDGDIEHSGGD